jgi:galactose mutarotase-like enzyme
MFETRQVDGPPRFVELTDTLAGSFAQLAPERGGMLTQFRAGETDVLYLDEVSFQNAPASVRGGVPILFPSPGKLTADAWRRDSKEGRLKRHGFARDLPWTVVRTGTDGAASATLLLHSSEATWQDYPWAFELEYTYSLRGASITIDQRIRNGGDQRMPFGAGLHPYFNVPEAEKASVRIETLATMAFDNVERKEIPFIGFDLTQKEVDLHLKDHGSTTGTMEWGGRKVTITCSAEMTRWVIWTLAGWDFVCLEPWTCPGDALNTGEGLIWLEPGEKRELSTRIEVTG